MGVQAIEAALDTAVLIMESGGSTVAANRCTRTAGRRYRGLQDGKNAGGGIVAVAPGRFAIAAFSPRLNEAGNSIRSLNAIRDIAGELGVGVFGANPN